MTMDSIATTQSLCENLQYAVTVKSNIEKIHEEFRGATVDNPIQILFEAYEAVPCYNFKKYILEQQQNDYLDGKLACKMAKSKFYWLVTKK